MRRHAGLAGLLLTVPIGAAVLMLTGPAAAGPATPYAMSTAVALEIPSSDVLGIAGYSGKWGSVTTGPEGGSSQSDFDDPDGVRTFVSVATKDSQTSGLLAPLVYDARTDLNTLFTGPSLTAGGPKLVSLATLQNYARCAPPAAVQASGYVVAATAFGQPLAEGSPVTADVTGTTLGLPQVRAGKVTVTLDTIIEKDGSTSAAVRTVITMTGKLVTTDGKAYDGTLATMTLGDVRVNCAATTPTPAPTETVTPTESPTPTLTPTEPEPNPPTPTETSTPTSEPMPTDTATPTDTAPTASPTDTATPTTPVTPTGPVTPTPPVTPPYGHALPVTGADLTILGGAGALLLVAGAGGLAAARGNRSKG